jgi:SAM-dependent methyltransferase
VTASDDRALPDLLSDQVAYYRARAPEYDATIPNDDLAHGALLEALRALNPTGAVLDLASGTGRLSVELARYADELTLLDASPEMLAIAATRVASRGARLIEADVFDWQPDERYDVVFFSAWLSHVPPQRFDAFWQLIDGCLAPSGRVFFVDELPAVARHEEFLPDTVAPVVERPLQSGARHRAVKVFYEPEALRSKLAALGWRVDVHTLGWRCFYATGARA